jgi:hypothetical protein
MPPRSIAPRRLAMVGVLVTLAACSRDLSLLDPAPFPNDPFIFGDDFAPGMSFQAFGGSKVDALSIDTNTRFRGSAALRFTIPASGDPTGGYAGGAFVSNVGRDLSEYDALTFWARASIPGAQLNVAGLGNDNTGTSRFPAERNNVPLSTAWQKVVIPIPLAERLRQERGLFFLAEGAENNAGYDLWIDEVRFERLGTLRNPRPVLASTTITDEVGATRQLGGTAVTYDVDGVDVTVSAAPAYFTFTSANPGVATVSEDGRVTIVAQGTTTITAALGATAAAGTVTVTTSAAPTVPAPTPTRAAGDVISLFSNAYPNRPVNTWSADWDQADVSDIQIAGNDTKRYTNLGFAGIEFTSNPIDARAMTHLHLDVFTANVSSLRLKLVDFGPNGVFGGGDDSEHEITLSGGTTPGLTANAWSSLDIPLAAFTGLQARGHLAQLIISNAAPTLYLDNLYFYREPLPPAPTGPATPAPTPARPAASVISLFSDAYTNVPVSTWSAPWDAADVEDVTIAGNAAKKYTNFVFAGIEFTAPTIDARGMTHFHLDYWTSDPTAPPAVFRMKLVDFGADGAFGGGDDVEHELTFDASTTPAIRTGAWVSLDIPLSAFTGLVTRGHLAQLILVSDPGPNTVWLDNVYFYSVTAPTAPTAPAPTPTFAPGNVISLFSDAYPNVPVTTWSAPWDGADVEDVTIGGNAVKKYTNFVFAGIEFVSPTIDARQMTRFAMDVWTADPTAAPAVFKIKLVDFGANGAFGGGDDVEHELTFDATTTPALRTGEWVRFDIPLSAFTGLVTRGHLAQLILVSDPGPNTVYVDNVLFRR